MTSAAPRPAAGVEADLRRWSALAVALLALFMVLLDISIVNVALPSIARSTGAGPSTLQWVVSGYVLAFGLVPVVAGRLGDDRGRRTVFLAGVAGFVLTSAVVGLAPTAGLLVAGRVLQGLAGGTINPQVAGLVQQLFAGEERGRAFGLVGATVGVATATGPLVGGALIALGGPELGWRLAFFVNVPIGAVVLLLGRRLLPAPPDRPRHRPLDLVGVGLLGVGLLLVLLPAVEYDATHDLRLFWLALPAAGLLAGFLRWERRVLRRAGSALLDLRLFRAPSYAVGVLLALLFFCGYSGLSLVLSLYYQVGLGYPALQAGLGTTALAVGSALSAALIGGRLVARYGRLVVVGAVLAFGAGTTAVVVVALAADGAHMALLLAAPLFLAGLGSGSVISPNQTLALAEVDTLAGSAAAGVLQTAQRVGAAFGTAVVGAVFFAVAAGAPGPDPGRYGRALGVSLVVTLGFAAAALLLGTADVVLARRP